MNADRKVGVPGKKKKAPDLQGRFIRYDVGGLFRIAICDIHGCSSGIDLVAVS